MLDISYAGAGVDRVAVCRSLRPESCPMVPLFICAYMAGISIVRTARGTGLATQAPQKRLVMSRRFVFLRMGGSVSTIFVFWAWVANPRVGQTVRPIGGSHCPMSPAAVLFVFGLHFFWAVIR